MAKLEGGREREKRVGLCKKKSLDQKRCVGGGGGRSMQRGFGGGEILAGGRVIHSFLGRLFYLFES